MSENLLHNVFPFSLLGESVVWLVCVIFVGGLCIFIRFRFSMKFVRFSSGSLGFRALVLIDTLFFMFKSFLRHKLVEISEWPSENNASSSNTLNDFINCSD